MKISSLRVYAYRLPLVRPLILKSHTLQEREGLLLHLTSDTGHAAWGEAAPLPGFSRDSLNANRAELCTLERHLISAEIPDRVERLNGQFNNWLGGLALCPSARFAIETAVLSMVARDRDTSLAGLFSQKSTDTVRVNGLITDDLPVLESVHDFVCKGYPSVKMKVGRHSLDEDLALTREVSRRLPDGVTLRIDANRAWTYEQAVRFAETVTDCELEYVEEPLADPSRLAELVEQTGMRVALDESLVDMNPEELSSYTYVSAIILKPTLLGGLERAALFARRAHEMKIKVIVSSCFESSVGIATLVQFASAYNTAGIAAGLDTLSWHNLYLLTEPIDTSTGRVDLAQCVRATHSVDMSMLTEVTGD